MAAGRSEPERRLITRTWRRIAIQTAALFAVGLVAIEVLAVGIVVDISRNDTRRQLSQAVTDPDAVTNPPIGVAVYVVQGDRLRTSPGAPASPIDPESMSRAADGPVPDVSVRRDGREYRVRTVRQGSTTIQVALDLTDQERERDRLYMGLIAAGAAGMVFAGGLGALIARRAIAPLGNAVARQQRFVADASHELRTPLTQLHTRAQLLEWELRSDVDLSRVREDVAQLVRGTRQMGELVEELLLSAQLRAEPRRFGPVDLHALAVDTVEAEQPRAVQRNVEISLVTAGDGPFVVRGTAAALRRVLASLVDNALSHTPESGHIAVELSTDESARVVEARVRDDGEGFDPAQAERLFERFYRGQHGGGRRYGLGLSLVQEVVAAHGGTVSATGAVDAGACFLVRLPAWNATGGEEPPET